MRTITLQIPDNFSFDKLEDFAKRFDLKIVSFDDDFDFHYERVKQGMNEVKEGLLVSNDEVMKNISDLLCRD
ncbi:hypothetical protein CCAN12_510005 [Capnocytophaga canimorsus]|uniref:Uncharacterized protein n=1 Tax=Capnocytophaga canimorsus TaxID=28188 RepID=A0A0B7H402_9FLAO|nr:hypothetical protein [Capnocytophaga canimorsus]ATA76365.1 hypothetical protein CGC47_01510 [Capnocytophaga canimorsus]ATA90930.1 hypothetical protein CGC56_01330 [Capnocytophaga canimorsus]MDT9500410.1 hypothetical protein [Capnocytophaga canimorsus]PJI79580.1 hypothetical protein CLV61_1466 [Capnocytophaga canimorsus]CEN34115.1 hypothetical protein CCAN12_510005 [Capnocytophaga canimorsus]